MLFLFSFHSSFFAHWTVLSTDRQRVHYKLVSWALLYLADRRRALPFCSTQHQIVNWRWTQKGGNSDHCWQLSGTAQRRYSNWQTSRGNPFAASRWSTRVCTRLLAKSHCAAQFGRPSGGVLQNCCSAKLEKFKECQFPQSFVWGSVDFQMLDDWSKKNVVFYCIRLNIRARVHTHKSINLRLWQTGFVFFLLLSVSLTRWCPTGQHRLTVPWWWRRRRRNGDRWCLVGVVDRLNPTSM